MYIYTHILVIVVVIVVVVAVVLIIQKLTRRIPPRVEKIECLGSHQVEADAQNNSKKKKKNTNFL